MSIHRVIYQPGETNLQSVTVMHEGKEIVAYTGGLTPEEYLAQLNFNRPFDEAKKEFKTPEFQLMTYEEAAALMSVAQDSKYKVGEYSEIKEELYDEMLNILPPCKWQTVNGVNIFYMSEMMTDNITNFFCRSGGKFFCGYDRTSTPYAKIAEKVKKLLA
jgi:hypothetical protein